MWLSVDNVYVNCTGWRGTSAQVISERCCCERQRDNHVVHWSWLVNVQPVQIAEFI